MKDTHPFRLYYCPFRLRNRIVKAPKQARLFLILQDDFSQFVDLEYCKTDLIASKGVVFCKFRKSSSALQALEAVGERGMVGAISLAATGDMRAPMHAWHEPFRCPAEVTWMHACDMPCMSPHLQ